MPLIPMNMSSPAEAVIDLGPRKTCRECLDEDVVKHGKVET